MSETHESLQVDESLEAEIEKALRHRLTDEDIERARILLGHYQARKISEHITEATPDALRNWAYGAGDDNPLYTDPAYGARTRWGSQIGHGTQVGFITPPRLGDRV
ncbi:MAG: hypothetical protein OXF61_09515, partial [Acidimicrobiaceae bacterium]|nr:hypothetical protein [Acidimicrobiaceae bacterium]